MTKIAVTGATGLLGQNIVQHAQEAGFEVVEISRSHGVDIVTGAGLEEVLSGSNIEVLIDAAKVVNPTGDDPRTPMLRSTQNLLQAAQKHGISRFIQISINGVQKPQLQQFPFYQAHFEQEELVKASTLSTTIIRSVQWFEFAMNSAGVQISDHEIKVQDWAIQPVAVEAVAKVVIEVVSGKYNQEVVTVAGPRRLRLPELTAQYLRAIGDRRPVITIEPPLAELGQGYLYAPEDAVIVSSTLEDWLKKQ